MTDTLDTTSHKPSASDRDELPTAYGGTNHEEPTEPGQSIGQEPDTDAAEQRHEAGEAPADDTGSDL